MSRSKKGSPSGACSGCPKCDWFPRRLQDAGKRSDRVAREEDEAASDLGLIKYDIDCELGKYDDLTLEDE